MEHWYSVVMAGGGGTRLWPASRPDRPKQLMSVTGDRSLLADTVVRAGKLTGLDHVLVVTRAEQVEASRADVPELSSDLFLAEPQGRNTAACIGLAAVVLRHKDPDAVMAVLPADHFISDEEGFVATAARALERAQGGQVVTVGIRPSRPETGYGYIEMGELADERLGVYEALRFVEKPDFDTAEKYLESGRFLWNAGMFFMKADWILAAMQKHMPRLAEALSKVESALAQGPDAFEKVLAQVYPGLEPISIDYGIMEKVPSMEVIPGRFGWNDVGSWSALELIHEPDDQGNVTVNDTLVLDSEGSIVYSDDGRTVAVLGVSDLVVVSSRDGVLVVPKSRAQEVRRIVAELAERKKGGPR